jgi:hypothetical protein
LLIANGRLGEVAEQIAFPIFLRINNIFIAEERRVSFFLKVYSMEGKEVLQMNQGQLFILVLLTKKSRSREVE